MLVAAGMDTRAWRLGLPAGCTVFELDRSALLELKAGLLARHTPAVRRVPVPVDLSGGWTGTLRAAGLDPARPTCWVVEGLLQYLPGTDVERLLDAITGLSADGSLLVYDVVGAGLMSSPRARPMLEGMAAAGSPWIFASDDPAGLGTARGWTCRVEVLGDLAAALGRPATADERGGPGGPSRGERDDRGYLVSATR